MAAAILRITLASDPGDALQFVEQDDCVLASMQRSSLTTGLAFLPQPICMAVLSMGPTAWLVGRYGARLPVLVGLLCAGAGLVLLAFAGQHQAYLPLLAGAFALIGIGPGLTFMPLLITGMSRVPAADAGLASGIINTSLQVSAAIGIAVFGTLSTNRSRAELHHGVGPSAALLSGYHLAFCRRVGHVR